LLDRMGAPLLLYQVPVRKVPLLRLLCSMTPDWVREISDFVSRRHARVRFVNERYLIEDLESLNGTFLNRRRLVPFVPEVLRGGDELRFGSLTFTVVLKRVVESDRN